MKIHALLSWYDEDPAWLTRCVKSLALAKVDHLIALDGPYALFDGPAKSPDDQTDAILLAAPCDVSVHRGGYDGNEVEKRNRLWELAEQHAKPGDWYMVFDADEYVTEAPADLHALLEGTSFDVGAVQLIEPGHSQGTIHFPTFPMFFRAIPGIRCHRDHFTYRTPDGRNLWGNAKTQRLEPRAMTGVVVRHESELRNPMRRSRAKRYYAGRDAAGIEELPEKRYVIA